MRTASFAAAIVCAQFSLSAYGQSNNDFHAQVDQLADRVESRVIAWRRDIHANPELGNREFRTAKLVAEHLRSLGLEVRTGIAHTGVVALLRGGKPGPVVALRADMDALPVTEQSDVPFASKVKAMWSGQESGVMHACGHDGHVAILMGVAEILVSMKDRVPGTVKFIFQPAEEGAPAGEEGGARLMVKQGVLADPVPAAIFGLHLSSAGPIGRIGYRSGPYMSSQDNFKINVKGRQTHGARPWAGVDPIVIAAQIVLGVQTIQSRQLDVSLEPSVITIGAIHGGNRENIIPDTVEMIGTIRTFDEGMRRDIHKRMQQTAQSIAQSAGGSAEFALFEGYDTTVNHEKLTERAVASLRRSAGGANVAMIPKITASEDFSAYQKVIPGFYFHLSARPKDLPPEKIGPNHSPLFIMDEAAFKIGVKALTNLTLDYLSGN
ncbi:MAG: amidohydrolase [Betaproteobacteria bacterium]|nr:amidohydrolase [Betaproteobacteria bacterium]